MTVRDLTARDIVESLDLDAIQQQRWFRHKGQVRGPASLLDGWPVRNHGDVVGWWLITGIPVEGGEAAYQIPVSLLREPPDGGAFGSIQSDEQTIWICDGSVSPVVMADLVARMRHNRIAPLERGRVVSQVVSFPSRFPSEFSPLNVDSSNTLIGLDRSLLLKLYRCLDSAGTREVRLMRTLTGTGTDAVPVLSAALEYQRGGKPSGAMATIQEWLFDAEDAWKWVTDRLKSGPADLDEDVEGMAKAVADIHRGLIGLENEDRDTHWKSENTEALKSAILSRLEELNERYSETMPHLRELVARTSDAVDSIHAPADGLVCEVHGDLHLGQFLRHEWHFGMTKYRLIDFEGEPLAASDDRAAQHSPMKDVAGMLRSFDYAAGFARKNGAPGSDEDWAHWSQRAESAFLSAYGDAMHMPELPGSATENGLLMLHVIEKAVYEIAYELSARPDWVDIPIGGLQRILDRLPA